jgi:hypothetical protein
MWIWLIILGTSIWVYFDAKSIGVRKTEEKSFTNMGPVGWLFCSLLLWIVAFPLYLFKRSSFKTKFQSGNKPAKGVAANAARNTAAENSVDMKTCPQCAEKIMPEANVCKHPPCFFNWPSRGLGAGKPLRLQRNAS